GEARGGHALAVQQLVAGGGGLPPYLGGGELGPVRVDLGDGNEHLGAVQLVRSFLGVELVDHLGQRRVVELGVQDSVGGAGEPLGEHEAGGQQHREGDEDADALGGRDCGKDRAEPV